MRVSRGRSPVALPSLLGVVLLLGAGPPPASGQSPQELLEGANLQDLLVPNAEGSYDIPGLGTIPQGAELSDAFPLDDPPDRELDGTYDYDGTGDTVIPAGTKIENLDFTTLQDIFDNEPDPTGWNVIRDLFIGFMGGPPQDFPADASYDLEILEIDSSAFPTIQVRFKAFPKDAETPAFDVNQTWIQNPDIQETVSWVQGGSETVDTRPVLPPDGATRPELTLCEKDPVAFAVALDTSCSVTSVLESMKEDAALFFEERIADNASRPGNLKDAAALYTFDGRGLYRAPGPTDSREYVVLDGAAGTNFVQEVRDVEVGPPCLGSPIYEGMFTELEKLRDYVYPDPTTNETIVRGLVTFADYRDTEGQGDRNRLVEEAKVSDINLIYLGFGRVNEDGINEVSNEAGGHFIQGADSDVPKVLREAYNGLARTYCLTYRSPHPNIVNEPATIEITFTSPSGAVSEATGRFPLPFVIPEDSRDVRMFIPVTELEYSRRMATGTPPDTFASLQLFDGADPVDGTPIEVTDPDPNGRENSLTLTVDPDTWDLGDDDGDGSITPGERGPGFEVSAASPEGNNLFKIPTDYVELEDPDPQADPAIGDGDEFYGMEIRFGDPNTGARYKGNPRVSIQDRTPPHVYVRISPQDGKPPYELRIFEEEQDQNPGFFEAGQLPRYHLARAPLPGELEALDLDGDGELDQLQHFGAKTAAVEYRWRSLTGTEDAGSSGGQRWSAGSLGEEEFPLLTVHPEALVFGVGALLEARTRADVVVYARDNYARINGVDTSEDSFQDLLGTAPPADPDRGPEHSRFDGEILNHESADLRDLRPPFLPIDFTLQELKDDPSQPGVVWWIRSLDPQDRYAGLENITEVAYPVDDDTILEETGIDVDTGGGIFRSLEVYAQDGQRNVTRLSIPLEVEVTGFAAETLQFQTGRGSE